MMSSVSAEKQPTRLDPQQFSINLLERDVQEIDFFFAAAHDELTERATRTDDGVAYYFAPRPEERRSLDAHMDTQPLKRCEEAFELLPEVIPLEGLAIQFLRVALPGRSADGERLGIETHCQGGYAIPEDVILWRGLLNLGVADNKFKHAQKDVRGLAPRSPLTVWEPLINDKDMRYESVPGHDPALRTIHGIMYPANRVAHTFINQTANSLPATSACSEKTSRLCTELLS